MFLDYFRLSDANWIRFRSFLPSQRQLHSRFVASSSFRTPCAVVFLSFQFFRRCSLAFCHFLALYAIFSIVLDFS